MDKKTIEKIIIKYIDNSINAKELDVLNEAIKDPFYKSMFEDYVKTHYQIILTMNDPDINKIKKTLLKEIKNEKSILRKMVSNTLVKYTAIAATIILLIGIPFALKEKATSNHTNSSVDIQIIKPGSYKAILTLENGKSIALEHGKAYQSNTSKSDGKTLVYNTNTDSNSTKLQYNSLTIPRGGHFFIQLSDSTKVWLNAETKIRYPIQFVKGKPREVEVIYGEAYFDVSSSEKHGGMTFKVKNQLQTIEVLGTEFNIKAYKDDDKVFTTLVEGVVRINTSTNKSFLKPGQKSVIDKNIKAIKIENTDVLYDISWKDGVFIFKKETLYNMMKTLSRWYNIDVVFEKKEKELILFSGLLKKENTINELLKKIEGTERVKFEINDKTITIK